MHFSFQGKSFNAENTDEVLSLFNEETYAVVNGRVIQPGFSLEEFGLTEGFQVEEVPRMLGGKVHGSLARAGKVKGQTPKVDAQEKKKAKTGRAKRRMQYNRRFVNVVPSFGKKKGPNSNS
ncbi:Oidioi.mRNA.OKI2018_I69.chr2.g6185.t1.cds [Oikopleura dioica]|uniref:Oidioi.mRNA.OKI2018_I69.chr2.g6185.t1.cds n=1 Tax=Oikopleura dioica TaxID=34765 RepID=A0ABN7T5V0_OIKDI|nr:Oidioi.mRNA.OKI2018_I69.chr2.g6185.t1.cds [Oikopleura dioica]